MLLRRDRKFFISIIILVIFLNTFPFWLAFRAAGEQYIFSGTLLNPTDGYTYLAKIYQGWRGDWRFTLPYTPNPGEGAYVYLFYLFLGHLARLTALSIPAIFTLFRIAGSVLLMVSLYRFFAVTLLEDRPRRVAFALAALGGGAGWLLIPANHFTADFWVAEAYPFLSMYDNPHFPLGLALIVWLLTPAQPTGRSVWLTALMALALSIVSPFGVVVVAVVLVGWVAWHALKTYPAEGWRGVLRHSAARQWMWTMLGGGGLLLFQFVAIRLDPVLSGWDAQNIALTPPWWDVFVSLSPALLFAVFGAKEHYQAKKSGPVQMLLVWGFVGLGLIWIPMSLQRRFMMGLYIPLAGLAALGVEALSKGKRSRVRFWVVILFLLALPTNLMIILAGQQGVRMHDPILYLTRTESDALAWLETNTAPDALVLASPGTGLLIPAFTGRQVIYGHPFETVNAGVEEQAVLAFFQTLSEAQAETLLRTRGVDYLFYGPRERALGALPVSDLPLVFELGDVQIFAVDR